MTCPKWIEEALAAAYRGSDVDPAALARELIERLPIEAMIRELSPPPGDRTHQARIARYNIRDIVLSAVEVLSDREPDAVTLTELYNDAARALDLAGVPYANNDEVPKHLDLAARVRWLAMQRPTKLELQRVESERDEARRRAEDLERKLAQATGVAFPLITSW